MTSVDLLRIRAQQKPMASRTNLVTDIALSRLDFHGISPRIRMNRHMRATQAVTKAARPANVVS
ncbi:hypothetical protein DXU07_28780 [Bradyrhizobium elkanii]|nr:hypothetical protein BLN97_08990 [Bradyrhizobium elkanii]